MADVWPRYKTGRDGKRRLDSWYYRKLRLKTKDATEARQRMREAADGKWPPKEEAAAKVTAAAFKFEPEAAPAPAPPGASSPPPQDPPPAAPPDWTKAAAAAAGQGATNNQQPPPPPPPPQVSSEQLAEMIVELKLKVAEIYVQQKVYEPFVAPPIAPMGRTILVGSYKAIFDYCGTAFALPPWVNGVVVPSITILVSSMAIVAGFKELALEQKHQAEQKRSEGGA